MSTGGLVRDSRSQSELERSLGALCEEVFSSMQRSDQRTKGERYARGLLLAEGRKSMRNIALQLGPGGEGQSMHHFISSSTWDWRPVREALARHLQLTVTPAAWVLRSMVVPKAGEHTVGVARRVDPESGRLVNSQQSFGLWLASRHLSSPVNWGLHLPAGWLADQDRRSRAKIPERLGANTPGECAGRVVLEVADGWGLPRRPVILEIGEEDATPVLEACASAGLPFLARVGPAALLTAADSVLPERIGQRCSAQGLVSAAAVRTLLRPVQWWDPVEGRARTTRVAAVRVQRPHGRTPDRAQAVAARQGRHRPSWGGPYVNGRRTLTLIGEWSDNRAWPTDFWLTDLTAPPGKLLRLAKLARRVERDAAVVGEEVGLRGFVGRSFEGWHRHTTLASVAHAVRVLDDAPAEYASA
ncbi:transposase [Kitasatospora sp. MMS16-BH015]|uniref:IS701 family transposase n=1 Tax=Kitasatospora sp. MMS16-BH015 TaxID=2018025 RepID=UPI000CA31D8E|nr:transposase [Kitasatospora sp. MMS16-BH015]AUG78034.1 transposase [Kitasatospora sp. MMS16-BH015]